MGKAQCDNCKSTTFIIYLENGVIKSFECSECHVIINVSVEPKEG